ncbi:serpin family protein [Paenibacillus marinisediminis]
MENKENGRHHFLMILEGNTMCGLRKSKSVWFIWGGLVVAITAAVIWLGLFPRQEKSIEHHVQAANLMEHVNAKPSSPVKLDQAFIQATADFSIDLFRHSAELDKNSLISPASVYLALGMTANGAANHTLAEMEALLGGGSLKIEDLNRYYSTLASGLREVKSGTFHIANSIWYKDAPDFQVMPSFLETNATYYEAAAYLADFNSTQTVKDINNWVNHNTDGLIDSIIDKIDTDTVMYLFNTVLFEQEWANVYNKNNVGKGPFKLDDKRSIDVEYMYSEERAYVQDDRAQGFIKPYKDNRFSFVAILPNEGISLNEYAASLTGESWLQLIGSKSDEMIIAGLPKFKYEYEVNLVDPLKELGLTDGFDGQLADFSRMALSSNGNVYIGDVLHKTYIQVDELGTKAGAVTKVAMEEAGAVVAKSITLNRPFLYAIMDNETGLPLFMGTVVNPQP